MFARSLMNKLIDFRIWVADVDPDITGVAERLGRKDIVDEELNRSGYELFR